MPDQRTLILGGARSGKSIAAERRLASEPEVLYVATGGDDSGDAEWAERVAKHQARRPATWGLAETIELVPLLDAAGPPLLIDCLTLWLSRTMDALDIWSDLEPRRAGRGSHRRPRGRLVADPAAGGCCQQRHRLRRGPRRPRHPPLPRPDGPAEHHHLPSLRPSPLDDRRPNPPPDMTPPDQPPPDLPPSDLPPSDLPPSDLPPSDLLDPPSLTWPPPDRAAV